MGAWHARLSASDTSRWWECPGAIPVEEMFPDLKKQGSSYAREGTCAHRLVEECLIHNKDAEEWLGRVIRIVIKDGKEQGTSILRKGALIKDDEVDFEVTLDMCEAVQKCVNYVRDTLDMYVGNPDTKAAIANGFLYVEQRVNPLPERDDTGGTGDITLDIFPDLFEVIDYKHGMGVFVPVDWNKQLLTYLRGGQLKHDATGYDRYASTICQPRHREAPEHGIMSKDYTEQELETWTAELSGKADIVDQARAFASEQASGGPVEILQELHKAGFVSLGQNASHCKFCDIKSICPAMKNKAQELASADFAEEVAENYEIERVGGNLLAVMLPWVDVMLEYFQAVRADGETAMLAGEKVDGWKVVRGKSPARKFKDGMTPEKAVEEAVKLGADRDKCYTPPKDPVPLSGPKLEKLVPAGTKRKKFAAATMFSPEAKLTIAPVSDKREEVIIDVAEAFKDDLE